MPFNRSAVLLFFLIFSSGVTAAADEKEVFIREDFVNLDNWEPFVFPAVKRHSTYSVFASGDLTILKAESNSSASALVYRKLFNVYHYPRLTWRWKVENVYRAGNATIREGDDYPLRIYILFRHDPAKAGFFEQLRYKTTKLIYGRYPPHSTLNYIWANRDHPCRVITSSYTEKSKLILMESGRRRLGTWQTETVNIVEDYRSIFGHDPPETASLAVMNDSDNTGEQSVSYLDYIEVYREARRGDS